MPSSFSGFFKEIQIAMGQMRPVMCIENKDLAALSIDLVKSLGATHVIDRSSKDVVSDILAVLGQVNPSVVFDAISEKETQETAWEVLAPGGALTLVLPPLIDADREPKKHLFNVKGGNVHFPYLRDLGYALYTQLPRLLAEGKLKVSPLI